MISLGPRSGHVRNMSTHEVYFTGPCQVEVREGEVPEPDPEEVRVRTRTSAISPGTELLVYRGQANAELPADGVLETLSGDLSFPLRYGYAAVGEVAAVGDRVPPDWLGETVFAFHPHASHFVAPPEALVHVPDGLSTDSAAMLPTVETAVNLVLDTSPRIGERVAVFGQGVVGLLVTRLLAEFPLGALVTADLYARRRRLSEALGADACIDPESTDVASRLRALAAGESTAAGPGADSEPTVADASSDSEPAVADASSEGDPPGVDLAVEVSGNPEALDAAVDAVGFGGRVVVGSWYGTKRVSIRLDGRFHRNRVELVSSQVSSISPGLSGRWTTDRRLSLAWRWLAETDVDRLVTHRVPIERAAEAYELLDSRPDEAVQVLFTYDG